MRPSCSFDSKTVAAVRQIFIFWAAGTMPRKRLFAWQSWVKRRRGRFENGAQQRRESAIMAELNDRQPQFTNPLPGSERAKMIVRELAGAAQSAAMSLIDEQTARATDQIRSLAEALHAAGRSFEQSEDPIAAEFAHSAARRVEDFAAAVGERQWTEIAAGLDDMARRRPVRFVAGAVALGFLAARLFTASSPRGEPNDRSVVSPPEGDVTATVASTDGSGESDLRSLPSEAQGVR